MSCERRTHSRGSSYDASARRGRRYPVRAHAVAVGAARRLRCDARAGVAPRNSLHSLRSCRSNSLGESDERSALRAPTPALRFSPPQKSPPPGTARRAAPARLFDEEDLGAAGKTVGGCAPAATYAALRNAGLVAARASAHRDLTRRDCSSTANAVSVASFATGHEKRGPEGSRSAGPTAASERRRRPARGFAARHSTHATKTPRPQSNAARSVSHAHAHQP